MTHGKVTRCSINRSRQLSQESHGKSKQKAPYSTYTFVLASRLAGRSAGEGGCFENKQDQLIRYGSIVITDGGLGPDARPDPEGNGREEERAEGFGRTVVL